MTEIDLRPFCAKEQSRYSLENPFVRDGYEYAGDLCIMVRQPTCEVNTDQSKRKLPPAHVHFRWPPVAFAPYPPLVYGGVCGTCDGLGEDECDLCAHVTPCRACCGTGRGHVLIGATRIAPKYDRLIRAMPGVEFAEQADPPSVLFRSGEIQGIVMAIVPTEEEPSSEVTSLAADTAENGAECYEQK